MRKLYFLSCSLTFFLVGLSASAQTVSNIRAESIGNLVIISYDLTGSISGQLYRVSVFSSKNDMQEALLYVRGDVGENIVPGKNKRIEWGAKKEIGNFDGALNFKIEAVLTFSPMVLKTPSKETIARRGRNYEITWVGGVEKENLQLELWKDSTLRFIITRTPNEGKYTWEIPIDLLPDDVYKIRLMSVSAPANFRFSEPFEIRRKIPLAYKLAPAGVLAGVGIYLLLQKPAEEEPIEMPEGPPKK
ncbi:Ser-Thr-rich GPI-anchored membrane family protein [Cytophagaceae bacterium YF14B1]|uniref:Ser-Thr-rich GPI-anchored membrane family protein n=1 Tax=Xanthocytophaga flava TaxID=3048013 RepID=A0AAE3UCI4_9BACT|nr:Ser-Thr-rich GPI-anchored membrane family protein [Xanthocytophaga flavus]MDJ1484819.1 Ser-Thr-rich GPI-anchored membrane family protein [Xanthocytophaga flavus]